MISHDFLGLDSSGMTNCTVILIGLKDGILILSFIDNSTALFILKA